MNTIIGVFDDSMSARRAMERLRDGPLMLEDVSIISKNTEGAAANGEDVSAGEGAAVGAVWGGMVGLTALLIPGVGPFIAGGALFAALTGAVTGAVVGGISAALIDLSGIPDEDARGYEDEVNNGKTLVAVKARDEDVAEVQRLLNEDGASTVRDTVAPTAAPSLPTPPRLALYDTTGKRVEQAAEEAATSSQQDVTGTPTRSWTSGEFVGEGQGNGPRQDTGKYSASQWVGAGQGPVHDSGEAWTSGQLIPDTPTTSPRQDTGEFSATQWVGEGQDKRPATPPTPPAPPTKQSS